MSLIRIVRMEFSLDKVEAFLRIFNTYKHEIASSPGCYHLELWKDATRDGVYFTYSIWESESRLEAYRESVLFQTIWPKTKALFSASPIVYSTYQVM